MPPVGARQAAFIRARWSKYIDVLVSRSSRTRLAALLGKMESRVAQWCRGERLVKAETAWEVGERVMDHGLVNGGGPTALWACGYVADLIDFLATLALDLDNDGPRWAIMWFCSLPRSMLLFESVAIEAVAKISDKQGEPFGFHDLRRFSVDFDLADLKSLPKRLSAINQELETPLARKACSRAWTAVTLGKTLRTRFEEKSSAASDGPLNVSKVLHRAFAAGNAMLAESVIDAVEHLREYDPHVVAMRAWRMLCEWAYYVQVPPDLFLELRPLLPTVYRSYENREFTDEEEMELRELEHARESYHRG